MIITKIIIVYFIQIRHTDDDFPATGTRLVVVIVTYNYLFHLFLCQYIVPPSMCFKYR